MGTKTLEVRPSTVDKSTSARALLRDLNADVESDFLFCLGDGKTDESLFSYLNDYKKDCITCTVGKKQTEAKYYLDSVRDVEQILTEMVKLL